MSSDKRSIRPTPAFLVTAFVLVLGLVPLPAGPLRSIRQSAQALEFNRADREASAAGYYEGIINVGVDGGRSELALRLLGKPADWVNFHTIGAARYLPGEPLQFDLHPNLRRRAFGQEFTTNTHGHRDREYSLKKPPGVFRIALLGASMDMGWGVGTDETYENRLEDWLNRHATRRGLNRRFEVLNFAVAAYSPLHRLESLRRKALAFEPDMVIYSATLLDPRLLEIHLHGLLQDHVESTDTFVRCAFTDARLTAADLARDAKGTLTHKETIKAKLRPQLWPVIDGVLGAMAAECRSRDMPLVCIIIPRAGDSDGPEDRMPDVARYTAIAAHHALPVVDLTDTFDNEDPAAIEIAPWDDHPNARGHRLLFQALAGRIVENVALYRAIFGVEPAEESRKAGIARNETDHQE